MNLDAALDRLVRCRKLRYMAPVYGLPNSKSMTFRLI